MQKINYLLPLLFLTSFYLQAAAETAASDGTASAEGTASDGTAASPQTVSAGQEQIIRALQDDIAFEQQKRQLSNELALEKLRAELQKVRQERTPAPLMPLSAPSAAEPSEPAFPQERATAPSVVLVSRVAGVLRAGVVVNGQLRLVGRHETFEAGGKKYRLVAAKNSQLAVKESE